MDVRLGNTKVSNDLVSGDFAEAFKQNFIDTDLNKKAYTWFIEYTDIADSEFVANKLHKKHAFDSDQLIIAHVLHAHPALFLLRKLLFTTRMQELLHQFNSVTA